MSDWNERVERAQVVFQERDTIDGRRIAILAMLDVFKDQDPRIVTNVCDECGQTVHRDPTPEEIEKYKEPDQRVRHPDGSEWYCHNDGSCPYQKKGGWKGSDTRPMTFAEAFKAGAIVEVKEKDHRLQGVVSVRTGRNDVQIQFFPTVAYSYYEGDVKLVKPAPEYE